MALFGSIDALKHAKTTFFAVYTLKISRIFVFNSIVVE